MANAPNPGDPSEMRVRGQRTPRQRTENIMADLMELNRRANTRNIRLAALVTLLRAISVLSAEIRGLIRPDGQRPDEQRRPDGQRPDNQQPDITEQQLDAIDLLIVNLANQLQQTDANIEDLIVSAKTTATALLAARVSLRRPGEGVSQAEVAATAANSSAAIRDPAPVTKIFAANRGGYKHSKTNSRKYMVKKFRSARVSSRRMNKKKRKTLRRSKR
jgi:hypothetical protein